MVFTVSAYCLRLVCCVRFDVVFVGVGGFGVV